MATQTAQSTQLNESISSTRLPSAQQIVTYYPTAKLDNPDPLHVKHYRAPYNINRRAKLSMFSSVLKQHNQILNYTVDKRFELVEKIEQACLNYTNEKAYDENIPLEWTNELYVYIYSITCAKISSNLSTTNTVNNKYLIQLIINNPDIIPDLPRYSSLDLYPEKYSELINKIEISKSVTHTVKKSVLYTCRRCYKKECTYVNIQNKSLDEGNSIYVTCANCGLEFFA